MIGVARRDCGATRPEVRTPGAHDAVLRLWVAAEAARLAGERLRQQLAAGQPGPGGVGAEAHLRPAQPGDLRRSSWSWTREDGAAVRRLDDAPTVRSGLRRPLGRVTATCGPRATRSRAAPRRSCATSSPSGCSGLPVGAAGRQGRRLEGPAAMSDLLYSDVEDDLRASVRGLLAAAQPGRARCWPGSRPATRSTRALWRSARGRDGPGRHGRAGALRRRRREPARGRPSSLEELGRGVAPVPYLSSAVVATTALLARATRPTR